MKLTKAQYNVLKLMYNRTWYIDRLYMKNYLLRPVAGEAIGISNRVNYTVFRNLRKLECIDQVLFKPMYITQKGIDAVNEYEKKLRSN